MVDFNNETTVSTPLPQVNKLLLIEMMYNAFNALDKYNSFYVQGKVVSQGDIKSSLGRWYSYLYGYLNRAFTKKEQIELMNKIKTELYFNRKPLPNERLLEIVEFLCTIMDDLKLTRVDLKPVFDRTNIEGSNKQNGVY